MHDAGSVCTVLSAAQTHTAVQNRGPQLVTQLAMLLIVCRQAAPGADGCSSTAQQDADEYLPATECSQHDLGVRHFGSQACPRVPGPAVWPCTTGAAKLLPPEHQQHCLGTGNTQAQQQGMNTASRLHQSIAPQLWQCLASQQAMCVSEALVATVPSATD